MEEIEFLFNSWNTCLDLVEDRGFILNENYRNLTEADFKYLIMEKKLDIFAENETKTKAIYIKFVLIAKLKLAMIKDIIEEIKNESQYENIDILIVLKTKPTNSILKLEKEKGINNIQIMNCKQLQINITKHFLVPQHIKLNVGEVDEVMRKYNLTSKSQFPMMLRDDPIARYYNYKSGDIIKIVGKTKQMNRNYEFYRCVK